MANVNQVACAVIVIFLLISAVICEDDSSVQGKHFWSAILTLKILILLSDPRTFGHHFLKRISFALIPTGKW